MTFGFSYVGAVYLLMLFSPNLLWTKNKPKDYEKYIGSENKTLLMLERVGEVLTCGTVLIFSDFNINGISCWSIWLFLSFVLMLLYEAYWVRYFNSSKRMEDFYSSFLGVPVAGATLPVAAFLFLAVYGKSIPLLFSVLILGVGHIGIHWNHKKEIEDKN